MPKKRYNAEEIIHKLRGADALLGQGITRSSVCEKIGVSNDKAPEALTTPGASFLGGGGGCCFRGCAAPISWLDCTHFAHSRRCVKTGPPRITNDSGRLLVAGEGFEPPTSGL